MTEGGAKASVPPPQHYRAPLAERLGVAASALLLAALVAAAVAGALAIYAVSAVAALVLGILAFSIGSLAAFVAEDAVARWRIEATVYAGRLAAFLPRRRGFIVGAREEIEIAIDDIDRIETREEVFSSLGVTTSQRSFEVVLKDGARVFLGADRAMLPAFFGRIVAAITARGTVPVVDRGMVEGKAGFLLFAGARVPEWGAPPLEPEAAARRMRARIRTPLLLMAAALLVALASISGR